MDAITAINKAITYTKIISQQVQFEISLQFPSEIYTEDYWMDRITPEAYFVSDCHLFGFVYLTIVKK